MHLHEEIAAAAEILGQPVEAITEDCSCDECRGLCSGNPGWFMPGRVARAADFLMMDVKAFALEYLIIEYWAGWERPGAGDDDDCYWGEDVQVLAPRRISQAPGLRRAAWSDNFQCAPCSLLTSGGCRLPHDRRPLECAVSYGCQPSHTKPVVRQDLIVPAWADCYDEIVALLQ